MGLFDHIDQQQIDAIEFYTRRNNEILHVIAKLLHEIAHHLPASRLVNPLPARNLQGVLTMSTATLTWVNPTARTDGSPLATTDIASVDVFDSVTIAPIGTVKGGDTVTFTTDVLSVGDHTFTVVVNDTTGHKSAPSGGATLTVAPTLAPPNVATSLAAVLNP